jgi:hypothetical protein
MSRSGARVLGSAADHKGGLRYTCYSLPSRENDRSIVNDRVARAVST